MQVSEGGWHERRCLASKHTEPVLLFDEVERTIKTNIPSIRGHKSPQNPKHTFHYILSRVLVEKSILSQIVRIRRFMLVEEALAY